MLKQRVVKKKKIVIDRNRGSCLLDFGRPSFFFFLFSVLLSYKSESDKETQKIEGSWAKRWYL